MGRRRSARTDSLTRFAIYDKAKGMMRTPADRHGMPAWKMGVAAGIAGAAGGVTGNPADIILVRMIADANRPQATRLGYRNWCAASDRARYEGSHPDSFDGLFRIIRDEGPAALMRGLAPNVSRAIIMNVSQLATCVHWTLHRIAEEPGAQLRHL
jgi:dicarboxylate transporter 10